MAIIILINLLLLSTAAGQFNDTLHPYCQQKCGNHSIPYPFGIGSYCSRSSDFLIVCKRNEDGIYYPYLAEKDIAVFDFSLQQHQFTTLKRISYDCYNRSGLAKRSLNVVPDLEGSPYVISVTHNKFTSIGCNTVAFISSGLDSTSSSYNAGCMAFCKASTGLNNWMDSGPCTGTGCCQTSLPERLQAFYPRFENRSFSDDTWLWNPCSYSFVVDQNWFTFNVSYLRGDLFIKKYRAGVPMVLEWVETGSCFIAWRNRTSYACRARNSQCIDLLSMGYVCNCIKGYEGNPYLQDGCHDIDECKRNYPCKGICKNNEGSYTCRCKEGYSSEDPKSINCTKIPAETNGDPAERNGVDSTVGLTLGLGIGLGIICLLTSSFWIYMVRVKRKLSQEKEKFFKQNGGLMLYEELRNRGESLTFKIFKKDELEKATNNFDKNLILGHGGQGTVYRGTLDNNMTVAIKKAKTIDENQKEGFIKEILIVSQINHNNIVKLLGCCLEVEIPMLVYEFVFNGTLHDYIHKDSRQTISLDTRLRIAAESAEALAYLHSSASPPILHRDVKSSNILVNENYIAKVSDFGASIIVANDEVQLATVIQGTYGYLDPEYVQTYVFTEKSDVYSFGVVLLELLTRKPAYRFAGSENEKTLASKFLAMVKQGRMVEFLDNQLVREGQMEVVYEVLELARQCVSMKPEGRPTMRELAENLQRIRRCSQLAWPRHSPNEADSMLSERYDSCKVVEANESYST